MRKPILILAAGLLPTTLPFALQAQTPAPAPGRITTPEGAQMDSGEDLAYKPGALTQAQLMHSTSDLFAQKSANVFRRFPREATDQMVKFYVDALGLKSLSPIQLTSSQQMLLTGVGSGQIKLSAGQQGNRKYHLDGGYKAGTGIRYFRLTLSRCGDGHQALHGRGLSGAQVRRPGRRQQGGRGDRPGRLRDRAGRQARRQGRQQ